MHISKVRLKNFRNYENTVVNLASGVNFFYGNNAQGKTNLIEGIYFCAFAKSFKFSPDMGFIKFGQEKAEISTSYTTGGKENENSVVIEKNKGKFLEINKVPVRKRVDFIGNLSVVLFSPQEMETIKEGPSYRRKYMDICAGQLRKKYLKALTDYNRTLVQKNKLLKEENDDGMIDVWNEKLAEYGSIIMWFRSSLVSRIKEIIRPVFEEISEGKEEIKLKYLKTFEYDENLNIEGIKKEFLNALERAKEKEKNEKMSIIGPHRDDLLFFINGKNAKIYGSQGQQKSIVLALKLVQAELFFQQTGEYPVLLLDDITSEFDMGRRKYLIEKLKGKQVVITGTEKNLAFPQLETKFFKVENGIITEE